MTYVLPIPLPQSLVDERRLIAKSDFTHSHHTVAFGPDGRGYVHSEIFYNYLRYKQGDGEIAAQMVTQLSPQFSITGQTWLEELHVEMTHQPSQREADGTEYVFNNAIAPLAVTEHGEVVFTTSKNRTFVYDANLVRKARFDPLLGEPAGFSDVIAVAGGIVAVRDRDRIGVAKGARFASVPEVREVASVEALLGDIGFRGYLGKFAALDLDRILVTQFVARGRSGWIDEAAFAYVVVGADGKIVGRFPLGAADTPYGKIAHDDSFVAHRALGAWFVRSDAALHVFDRDGARLVRIGLAEDERFTAIVPLTLIASGPNGELVMVSKKHHLLVVTDPIHSASEVEGALVDAGAVYASELARLKKAVPYANGRWFGWEATTPRAIAGAPKKKSARKAKTVEAPPPKPAKTPAEAVALAPDDADTLSVYADSLAETDPALSEYINVNIRLHRAKADDPERDAMDDRSSGLWREHGKKWLRGWNQPLELFVERFFKFCGMPCAIELQGNASQYVQWLDKQLANLPIQTITLAMSMTEIKKLGDLALLRRITQLLASGSSKHKLGKTLLVWIAEQQLVNLQKLNLYSVACTGTGLADVLDTLPRVRELTVSTGQLSAEGLAVVGDTAAAQRLESLSLNYNPLGSSVAGVLAKFPNVAKLQLHNCDLGDDLTAPATPLAVRDLNIEDNARLGAKGLAWIVESMPELREVRLPREIEPSALAALIPIAGQLEVIDASWMSEPAKTELVWTVLPHAKVLRSLKLTGDSNGLAPGVVAHTQLEHLDAGNVTDDDLAAIGKSLRLKHLELGEGTTDDNIRSLAQLPNLEIVEVHSHAFTEVGVKRLLDMQLSRIELMYVKIGDTSRLRSIRDRPFVLRLFKCEISKGQLEALRHEWGDRLIA